MRNRNFNLLLWKQWRTHRVSLAGCGWEAVAECPEGPSEALVRSWAALEASVSFGRSLDEVERTSSLFTVFPADRSGVAAAAR
jgi:hypothetical protein